MSVPFEDFGGSVVYDLEQKHTVNEIIELSRQKNKDERDKIKTTNYVALIDGLELSNEVTNLCISGNKEYLYIGGSDPPQIVCFELENFCEKTRQHTYYHIVSMLAFPGDDPFKVACLYDNRYCEFFCQNGKYEKIRFPKFCREMVYYDTKCDLYACGYGNSVYRFNLELGKFYEPFELKLKHDEILSFHMNPVHHLFAFGCEDGVAEFYDPRSSKVYGMINCCKHIRNNNSMYKKSSSVNKIVFDHDGVSFAVGTNNGQVGLFDLRKDGVVRIKDHYNDTEITSIIYHPESKKVISSDKFSIKIWKKNDGVNVTNMEPRGRINDLLLYPGSGMLFCAQQREKVTPYYIPILGPTPYWCSFLNSYLGEIEEMKTAKKNSEIYVNFDYKFLTVEEVKKLNLNELIGTDVLKPHLHGYLLSMDLYKRANTLNEVDIQKIKMEESFKNQFNEKKGKRKEKKKKGGKKRKRWDRKKSFNFERQWKKQRRK